MMDRSNSKKARLSWLDGGDSHYAMDSDGSSPDEMVESLITGFRATLSKLDNQFSTIVTEYQKTMKENHDLKRQIEELLAADSSSEQNHAMIKTIPGEIQQEMPSRSGIPKSKSHFSKLKKAYNETSSKVSSVVSAGFRNTHCQGELVTEFIAHRDAIQDIKTTEKKNFFITASLDKTAKVWSEGGQCRTKYQGHIGAVNTVALHPTEDLAISGSGDTEVHLWPYNLENMNTDHEDQELVINQPILRIGNHESIVSSIAFCQNERVFTVGFDGKAQVHDLETAKSIVDLCGHECAINHCSAHPTQPNLVTTSCKDGSIRVWDYRVPSSTICISTQHRSSVSSTCFLDNNSIISSSEDKTVRIFDFRKNRPIERLSVDSAVNRLSVNSAGVVALPHDDRHIRLLTTSSNQTRLRRIRNSRAHQNSGMCTAWLHSNYSSNNNEQKYTVLSGGWDRRVCIWRVPVAEL
ncbi:unnamed protein product [Oikopleura dioica]|uniref:WD repeat-containing protein 37 n=1 Tax=Oikopleura dioica TaxID=34765 RepID=E4YD85_OIKDI|nr:unnamed protein product [Oikopleura dioica]